MTFVLSVILSLSTMNAAEFRNWPREIISSSGKITIFQPEIESLDRNRMECRSAVIIETPGDKDEVYGAIWYVCRIATDRDDRRVRLLDIDIVANKFPGLDENEISRMNSIVEREVPEWDMVMSMDELTAGLEQNQLSESEQLYNEAPEILFVTKPTALVLLDGDPILKKVDGVNLKYVVNTPFFIVMDPDTDIFYLNGGNYWYSSRSIFEGWRLTSNVPAKVIKAEKMGSSDNEQITRSSAPSSIIVRTHPAELLSSNGAPRFSPVRNTSLLYVTNSDDDILMDINSQLYYVLISGRWYRSRSLISDNWTFVPPDALPEDFRSIPEDSPVNNVLSSIAGTREAMEAVLETRIPQTAEIRRGRTKLDIYYDGDPQFDYIRGTQLKYAINTDKAVIYYNGTYYCCDDAVWFESYNPYGPWEVSVSIPAEFMSIPPDNPIYNVRYVFIYDYTPDVVRIGYYPGYTNNYIYRGCVFYGTGYHYKPWYRTHYFPRPLTYGFNVHYNPFTGWGFSYGTPFGGVNWIRFDNHFHKHTHGYWGPVGYRHGQYHRYNLGDRRGYSPERPRPQKNDFRDNPRDNRAFNNLYNKKENEQRRVSGSTYRREPNTSRRPNNVYTDDKGNVYKARSGNNWVNQTNQVRRDQTTTRREDQTPVRRNQTPTTVNRNQPPTGQNNVRQDSQIRRGNNTQNPANSNRGLNEQYNSRERSNKKTETYNNKRDQYQYTQPRRESPRDNSVNKKRDEPEKKEVKKSNSSEERNSEKRESTRQPSSSGSTYRR